MLIPTYRRSVVFVGCRVDTVVGLSQSRDVAWAVALAEAWSCLGAHWSTSGLSVLSLAVEDPVPDHHKPILIP